MQFSRRFTDRVLLLLLVSCLGASGATALRAQTASPDALTALFEQARTAETNETYEQAFKIGGDWAARVERAETATAGKPGLKTATALGGLAWFAILARQHDRALDAAVRGFALAPGEVWIEANRALALILMGRGPEAVALHRANLTRPIGHGAPKSWQDTVEDDLRSLLQRGIGETEIRAFVEASAGLVPGQVLLPQPPLKVEREARRQGDELGQAIQQLFNAGKTAEALAATRAAVETLSAMLGADHTLVGLWVRGVGDYQYAIDPKVDVRPLYVRALAIVETRLGREHPDAILPLRTLATLNVAAGDAAAARQQLERAIDIARLRGVTRAKDLAEAIGDLAEIDEKTRGAAAGSVTLERALAELTSLAGKTSEAVAQVRVKLAQSYAKTGRAKEADAQFAAAVLVLETMAKPDHHLIASSLGFRALYAQKTNRKSSLALELSQRMIGHMEQAEVPNVTSVRKAHEEALWGARAALGGQFTDARRYAEAEDMLARVLRYSEQEQPPNPIKLARALVGMGLLFAETERREEAVPLLERALAVRETQTGADENNLDVNLHQLALSYSHVGRLPDAERMYKRLIDLRLRRFGLKGKDLALAYSGLGLVYTDLEQLIEAGQVLELAVEAIEGATDLSPGDRASMLDSLALWQRRIGRYREAEATARQSLALQEAEFGPEAHQTAQSVSILASTLAKSGRAKDAEPLYRRAIVILERRPDGDAAADLLGSVYNNYATVLSELGRFEQAEALFRKTFDLRKARFGEQSSEYAQALGNYASFLSDAGDDKGNLEANEQALKILEKVHGPEHSKVAVALNNVANSYQSQDRYAEAERAMRRAIAINEKVYGPDSLNGLTNLHNLAGLLNKLGRTEEALKLYARVVADRERLLGVSHVHLAASLTQQSQALSAADRFDEAIASAKRALEIVTSVYGKDHSDVAAAHAALGLSHARADQYETALEHAEQGLDIRLAVLRADHPDIVNSYNNIGVALRSLGRLDDAESAFRKALAIVERTYGAGSHHTHTMRGNLAHLTLARGDWFAAIAELDDAIQAEVVSPRTGMTSTYETSTAAASNIRGTSISVMQAAAMALKAGQTLGPHAERAVFDAMQRYVAGVASERLNQTGRRWGANDPRVAGLIRERQDNGVRIAILDRQLSAGLSLATDNRDGTAIAAQRAEFKARQERQASIDREIQTSYPAYFDLVRPKPLTLTEMQGLLRDDEVAVIAATLRTPKGKSAIDPRVGLVLAITRTGHRLVRLDLGGEDMEDVMNGLRCGLDATAWSQPDETTSGHKVDCAALLGRTLARGDDLPFDLDRAYRLYKTIFGGIEDLTKGRQLLIVSAFPLANMPWHVLVTDAPSARFADASALRRVAWLGLRNPITVLPSPASLRALRQTMRPSQASRPWIGFGNPLLHGPDTQYTEAARSARERQRCGTLPTSRPQQFAGLSRAVRTRGDTLAVTRANILAQAPLPETADELCDVAEALGALEGDVHIGAAASKATVQRLDRDGTLASYRMLHFATHATKAGEITPTAEPGLILTPAADGIAGDDGYLTASEIGDLKLDADWVILSACNTASSGGDGSALSGLAQAFFYAGARSLLVSHWYVDSAATERLVKTTLTARIANLKLTRAEALQHGMRALIASDDGSSAHPSKWAPFVVVGDGGTMQ